MLRAPSSGDQQTHGGDWSQVLLVLGRRLADQTFLRIVSFPQARKVVKKAKLNIDKVMGRYQPLTFLGIFGS